MAARGVAGADSGKERCCCAVNYCGSGTVLQAGNAVLWGVPPPGYGRMAVMISSDTSPANARESGS